jgi:pSer/pThr/pTyr-binding forkhead associated (FHA) protein
VSHARSPSELVEVLVAEREGAPFLECRDSDERLHLFRTAGREERPLSVGRGPDMDLAITWDPKVSSLHAELACVGGEWTVTDVGSTNGTFLNDERIKERRRLHDGDRVRVGATVLVFRASPTASVEPTHVAADQPEPPELTPAQRRVLVALVRGRGFPASNEAIAEELVVTVGAVKMQMRELYARFEISELPQGEKRARLAELAREFGLV